MDAAPCQHGRRGCQCTAVLVSSSADLHTHAHKPEQGSESHAAGLQGLIGNRSTTMISATNPPTLRRRAALPSLQPRHRT
eukprot:246574-Chlamydomonas_euryale.AAC.2